MAHVGDLVAETLARYGIDTVFGQPGGQTASLYDGIARRAPRIQHLLIRDERSAGYAADAYARLTGRPGVVDVTVGPGTTKLADGLLESLNASVPIVAIVGELPQDWEPLRRGGVASQGMDQIAFLRTMTKDLWTAPSVKSLPSILRQAFRTATSGRPGPVAVIIPHDVFDAEWDEAPADVEIDETNRTAPAHRPQPPAELVANAVELLARAQRPVIVAGGGVLTSRASAELHELASRTGAAVVTSFTGKGAVDETQAYAGGVLNPLGTAAATNLARKADLLLWVGCKIGQNTSLNWSLPGEEQATISIDIDGTQLGRTFKPGVALQGDARATLAALLDAGAAGGEDRGDWAEEVASVKAEWEAARDADATSDLDPLFPGQVTRAVNDRLDAGDVVISDASFSAGWISQYMPATRAGRDWIFARGLGGLGYSLPAALGAAAARPGNRVVTISGDGGFQYSIGEIAAQAQYGVNAVHVVLNNGKLGWLQMWQQLHYEGLRQSVDLELEERPPDFAAAGAALGGTGFSAHSAEDLGEALDAAFAAPGPSVVDVRIQADATPIASYRKRLESGKFYPRPGTVYGLRAWNASADLEAREGSTT